MPRRAQERANGIRTLHEKLKPLLRDYQGRELDKIMQEVDDKVAPE
ncbi:MAG: hypothetical protein ABF380_05185 [Akkermansiaceae bacterium]